MSAPWNGWFHCNGTLKGNWLRGDERGWRARHHREHVDGDYRNLPPQSAHAAERQHSRNLMHEDPVVLELFDCRKKACRLLGGALLFYGVDLVELAVTAKHYHALARFESAAEKHRAAALKAAMDDPDLMADDEVAKSAGAIVAKREADATGVPVTGVPATGVAGLSKEHHFKDGRDPLPRYLLGKCHSWTTREFKKWLQSQSPGTPVPGTGLFASRPHCKPIADEAHFHNVRMYIADHIDEGGAVWSLLIASKDF